MVGLTISLSPQCRGYNRALRNEKLLHVSPLFPVGGGRGAVVTNDWYIVWKIYSGNQALETV